MHGRVKVRTSAEQEAIKKKERAEKVARYRAGISVVFEKRKNKIYDDELMTITERMLLQNPDVYTLWNIRREVFKGSDWNEKELKDHYQNELTLTENCLKENHKSYCVWYQRIWIINCFGDYDWKKELTLCDKCLNLDERNFHCWNYRQFIVQKAEISPREEFEFASAKILHNFSNYSSWHYRSQQLSKMFSSSEQERIGDSIKNELQLVMHATYTDPNDSSPWFYQRWLLDTRKFSPVLSQALIKENNVILFVSQNVLIESICIQITNEDGSIEELNNQMKDVQWKSWSRAKFSKLWFGKLNKKLSKDVKKIRIKIKETFYPLYRTNGIWIHEKRKYEWYWNREHLWNQLSQCEDLSEMEPNNKWARLAVILLMRKLERRHGNILTNLDILVNVDSLRSNYYKDLRDRYLIDRELCKTWNMEQYQEIKLDLSGLKLRTFSDSEHLSFFTEVNLDENFLSESLYQLSILQNCKTLSLSNNRLQNLTKFPALENLEVLSLRDNELKDCDEILQFLTKHELKSLDLRGNPVSKREELRASITQINSNLQLYI